MKVLVTGATGFAGFHAAIALGNAGHQVYGLVRDDTKSRAIELQRHEVGMNVTSTWFDQNEFITSRKAYRLLGWIPRHTGILDEIETYYASWKAAQSNSK